MNLGTPASPNRIRLEEIASFEMGQSPDSRYVSEAPIGLPFLQGNAEFGVAHPQPRLWCRQPKKVCQVGDSLISVRAPVGALNRADQTYCIGRGLAAVRFNLAEPRYGAHLLAHFAPNLRRKAQGTTFEAVGKNDLATLEVNHFPEAEQARIAEVLDTLDEAIRGTELVIKKLEADRHGALRSLLTIGIKRYGHTRSVEERMKFTNTPIGPLPPTWSVARLGDLLNTARDPSMRSGPFGSELLKKDLVQEGVPLIGIDNVEVERFATDFTRFVTPWKFADLSRYRSFPKDILITIMGTVGRCCLVPDDIGDALTTKHVWALSLDLERYSPLLACLQINHAPWVLRHLNRDQQGGIMSAIRAETLRSILLPVPPREEREAIEDILHAMGAAIATETERVMKLKALKSGLSSDLLTGRVRTLPH